MVVQITVRQDNGREGGVFRPTLVDTDRELVQYDAGLLFRRAAGGEPPELVLAELTRDAVVVEEVQCCLAGLPEPFEKSGWNAPGQFFRWECFYDIGERENGLFGDIVGGCRIGGGCGVGGGVRGVVVQRSEACDQSSQSTSMHGCGGSVFYNYTRTETRHVSAFFVLLHT